MEEAGGGGEYTKRIRPIHCVILCMGETSLTERKVFLAKNGVINYLMWLFVYLSKVLCASASVESACVCSGQYLIHLEVNVA